MLCEHCGRNEADVHFMRIMGGERKVEHICRECAKQILPMDEAARMMKMSFSLEGFAGLEEALSGLLAPVMGELIGMEKQSPLCPNCGEPLPRELLEQSAQIEDEAAIKALCRIDCDELTDLKNELARAVRDEFYERAAYLRDRIRTLEEKKG